MGAKLESFLHQIAESMESLDTKMQIQEVAVLTKVVAANMGTAVHGAVEKAVNARMFVCKKAAKFLTAQVKMGILILDPFHPELCSGNVVKNAMKTMPLVPMHILPSHSSSQ